MYGKSREFGHYSIGIKKTTYMTPPDNKQTKDLWNKSQEQPEASALISDAAPKVGKVCPDHSIKTAHQKSRMIKIKNSGEEEGKQEKKRKL